MDGNRFPSGAQKGMAILLTEFIAKLNACTQIGQFFVNGLAYALLGPGGLIRWKVIKEPLRYSQKDSNLLGNRHGLILGLFENFSHAAAMFQSVARFLIKARAKT
jgi:hypothetical protein